MPLSSGFSLSPGGSPESWLAFARTASALLANASRVMLLDLREINQMNDKQHGEEYCTNHEDHGGAIGRLRIAVRCREYLITVLKSRFVRVLLPDGVRNSKVVGIMALKLSVLLYIA